MPPAIANLPWRSRQALYLTLAVWALGLVQFTTVLMVWNRGAPPAWAASFLATAMVSGMACSGLLYLLSRLLDARPPQVRWPALALSVLALAFSQSVIDHLAFRAAQGRPLLPLAYGDFSGVVVNVQIYSWLYGLYVVALELLRTMESQRARERQLAEARAAAQEARLEALRFQLNPHFLFNTLNAISGLVIKDRNAEADAMTTKLASFLRATLETDAKQSIPLADELATIEAYLEIEAVRFGERLRIDIDCPPRLLGAEAPSFILQPLVENAVKYAVAPSRTGASIQIAAREEAGALVLSVRDTGRDTGRGGGEAGRNGAGVGLRNTRARLATLYGEAGRLHVEAAETGFLAEIRMPLQLEA